MCLSRVVKRFYPKPDSPVARGRAGYKWFFPAPTAGEGVFVSPSQGRGFYRLGEWTGEGEHRDAGMGDVILAHDGRQIIYPTGFHLFPTISDAREYARSMYSAANVYAAPFGGLRLLRVSYRGVLARGYQAHVRVLVVSKIRLDRLAPEGEE